MEHKGIINNVKLRAAPLGERTEQQFVGQFVFQLRAQQTPQRPCAHGGVKALAGQPLPGARAQIKLHVPLFKAVGDLPNKLVHNAQHHVLGQAAKRHEGVEPVAEFRAEDIFHSLEALVGRILPRRAAEAHGRARHVEGPGIGGHDQDHVREVRFPARVVGQGGVVHHLKQHVEDVGMGLFHLVQQHYGIRSLAHGLGEQTALVKAHIAWRRADKTRHRVLFHIFAHVIAQKFHAHELGKAAGHFCLAHASGTIEQKGSCRALLLPKARAGTQNGPHRKLDGRVLAKHNFLEVFFKRRKTVAFRAGHGTHGNARHARHNALHVGHAHSGARRLAARSGFAARRLFASAGLNATPKADGSAGFVQHVNGLVRQQTVAHMPGRQIHHGLDGRRAVLDLVEVGIALFKPLKDGEAFLNVRFIKVYALEPPGQGTIFFKMVAKLFIGRGADTAQIAVGQHGLEQVGGVHGAAGCGACPHNGMNFVNKQNGVRDFHQTLHHSLEAAFKVAPVAGARQQKPHVQGEQLGLGEHFRHVALNNAQSQPLGQGCLAHAGIAHKKRIVFASTAQHFHRAVKLVHAAHQGVYLALAGAGGKVNGILGQGIGLAFLVVSVAALASARGAAAFVHTVRHEGQHIKTLHALLAQIVVGIAFFFIHDGNEQVAQFHGVAPGGTDMVQGAFKHALYAFCLGHLMVANQRHGFHFAVKKFLKLLAQHGHTGPAALKQNTPAHAVGKSKKNMLHGQQVVASPVRFHKGVTNDALNTLAQHRHLNKFFPWCI